MKTGRARVYVCGRCGLISLFKPESKADYRSCPGCGDRDPHSFKDSGEIARFEIEEKE